MAKTKDIGERIIEKWKPIAIVLTAMNTPAGAGTGCRVDEALAVCDALPECAGLVGASRFRLAGSHRPVPRR